MQALIASYGVQVLVVVLGVVFIPLLGMLAKRLHDLIDAQVKNEQVRGVLDRLSDTALTVVQEVEQVVVSKLAPGEPLGVLAINCRDAAVLSLKTHLGPKGLDEVKKVLGIGNSALEQVILSYIESRVHTVNMTSGRPLLAVGTLKTDSAA